MFSKADSFVFFVKFCIILLFILISGVNFEKNAQSFWAEAKSFQQWLNEQAISLQGRTDSKIKSGDTVRPDDLAQDPFEIC